MAPATELEALLARINACRLCEAHLPLGPRPVVRAAASAKLLIIGQAPGTRVHETGVPWNDRSGARLRQWLDMEEAVFYDARQVALVPMGFCYPGRDARGGDLPPRPECAPAWHGALLEQLPDVGLIVLAGAHAQRYYLQGRREKTLTETVRAWERYQPKYWPIPHPSFRNTRWLQRNPWFEAEVLPALRRRVWELLGR